MVVTKSTRLNVHILPVGQMASNCYLLEDTLTHTVIVIDPGDASEYIIDHIQKLQAKPLCVIATHGHFDHVMGVFALTKIYAIPFYMNKKDEFLLSGMQQSARHFLGISKIDPPATIDKTLREGDAISLGNSQLSVIETPGHTPGSVCLYDGTAHILFGGDLVFEGGSVGRTDFSYSDSQVLMASLNKIITLPNDTIIYPGHGASMNISTI